jgi:hypothetical protein
MEVAEAMQRSYGSIIGRAQVLGLKKDPAYINEMLMKEAQKLKKSGEAYRYKPGNVSYNKGKSMNAHTKEKLSHTFFAPGHHPWNHKQLGHERLTKDGYLMVKLRDRHYVLKHKSFLIGVKKERRPQVYLPNDIFLEATGEYNMLPMVSYLDSGSSAAMLAAFDGHQKVFLFGFDGDLGRGWQTLYDDVHPYYENKVDFPLDSWKNNLFEVMSAYKDTKFYRLQSDGQSAPSEWRQLPNFKDVSFIIGYYLFYKIKKLK